jgi:hypothetical protein
LIERNIWKKKEKLIFGKAIEISKNKTNYRNFLEFFSSDKYGMKLDEKRDLVENSTDLLKLIIKE